MLLCQPNPYSNSSIVSHKNEILINIEIEYFWINFVVICRMDTNFIYISFMLCCIGMRDNRRCGTLLKTFYILRLNDKWHLDSDIFVQISLITDNKLSINYLLLLTKIFSTKTCRNILAKVSSLYFWYKEGLYIHLSLSTCFLPKKLSLIKNLSFYQDT